MIALWMSVVAISVLFMLGTFGWDTLHRAQTQAQAQLEAAQLKANQDRDRFDSQLEALKLSHAKLATEAQSKIAELESTLKRSYTPPSETWLQITQRVGPPTTDKITDHAYNRMYDRFLNPIQHKDLKMLEIGLGCDMSYGPGASALIWDAFLSKNSEIWEAEVDAECVAQYKHKLGRINAVTGDQGDKAVLDRWLAETGGNFDFISDDGGYRNDQILNSFGKLWPALKPGGY